MRLMLLGHQMKARKRNRSALSLPSQLILTLCAPTPPTFPPQTLSCRPTLTFSPTSLRPLTCPPPRLHQLHRWHAGSVRPLYVTWGRRRSHLQGDYVDATSSVHRAASELPSEQAGGLCITTSA